MFLMFMTLCWHGNHQRSELNEFLAVCCSWHLLQVLQSVQAQYRHLSAYNTACLHLSFAAQLESIGMWEWAVFVVLHLEDRRRWEKKHQHFVQKSTDIWG